MHQQKLKNHQLKSNEANLTFLEHLHELRRRLVYVIASVALFATLAYFVQQRIVNFLLRPSHGQQFIYTSPGGGINFLFTVCTYVGIALSIPIIIYQILGFFEPLIKDQTRQSIIKFSSFSIILATIGFFFGYYVGLPSALHFLGNQFTTAQIHALFTLQEYLSFLTIYLVGSMLLFQLPIVLLFIDRIKPLSPKKLLGAERYVIVAAFIISMFMAPTPNVLDQLIIAGPIIIMFNLGVLMIWSINKKTIRPQHIVNLAKQDKQIQDIRVKAPLNAIETPSINEVQPSRRPRTNYQGVMDIKLRTTHV
ncbi:MAG TPA: twin-arginine translocase subunit TatC [Candidatus Saccharimonadales bacterium]